MLVDLLVEGDTDEVVANKLLVHCGHEKGSCFGKRGANYLLGKLRGFSVRARYGNPMLVMVDLMDTRIECARELVPGILANRPRACLVRGVIRELESWLLADREAVAGFLRISRKLVPAEPERLADPKQSFVNLARRCRNRARREAIVPNQGVSSAVGPGYVDEVIMLVNGYWDPDRAMLVAPSLRRCVERLRELQGQ